jgi:hypothetical protein
MNRLFLLKKMQLCSFRENLQFFKQKIGRKAKNGDNNIDHWIQVYKNNVERNLLVKLIDYGKIF